MLKGIITIRRVEQMPTEASRRIMECNKRLYDRILVYVPKGNIDAIKQHAKEMDMSMSTLINSLLRKELGINATQWKHPNE